MRKALVISTICILAIGMTACGKKKDEGPIIIEAQDNGRDTTTSELVQGDSAGKADSDMTAEEKQEVEAVANETVEGWHPDVDRAITILGEWDVSDGSKWILDNGYYLQYIKDNYTYVGSYGFTYTTGDLSFNIWNVENTEEVEDTNADGEVTGTHEYKYYTTDYKNFKITSYEHNDNYTSGTLKVIDQDGKELTATLTKAIPEDLTAKTAFEYQEEFNTEQQELEDAEYASREGLSVEEYKAQREAEQEIQRQAFEQGLTVEEYKAQNNLTDETPSESTEDTTSEETSTTEDTTSAE